MGKLSLCSAGKAAAGKGKAGEGPAAAGKITSFLLDKGAAAAGAAAAGAAGAGGATPSTKLKPGAPLGGCSSQHAAAVPCGKAAAAGARARARGLQLLAQPVARRSWAPKVCLTP